MKSKFTVDYFIEKFTKIPDSKWAMGNYRVGQRKCALGHCGYSNSNRPIHTEEGVALSQMFAKVNLLVSHINDGFPEFGVTPKERILVVLEHIKGMNI